MRKEVLSRLFFFGFLITMALECPAQFSRGELGLNGLTCSQCSKSIEQQLKKIPYIDRIHMDLEKTTATVYFKKGSQVAPEALAKAVENAGFSLRYLKVELDASQRPQVHNGCFSLLGDTYALLPAQGPAPIGGSWLRFLGKPYGGAKAPSGKGTGQTACSGNARYHVARESTH